MRIFAIDPGNKYSAFAVMDDEYNLIEFAKIENEFCKDRMLDYIGRADPGSAVNRVIIERIASYGMAVGAEVFETCEWIGRYTQAAIECAPVDYIYRKEEKLYICGDSKAKDANIRAALIERFAKFDKKNGKGTKKNPDVFYGVSADCWAAIAVAVTWLDKQNEIKIKQILKERGNV